MSDCDSDEESSAASLAQSDRSKEHPIRFCLEHKPSKPSEALKMSDCVSDEESSAASLAQSDRSKEHPIRFSLEHKPSKPPEALKMSDCVSDEESSAASLAQSDRSKEHPIRFCLEHKPSKPPEALKMSDCDSDEESSAASLAQSDRSKEHPIRFSLEHKPSKPPEALKMSDCVSDEESSAASLAQSDRSKEHPIRFCLEHKPSKPPEALKMSDCDSDEESSAASLAQSDRSKEHPIRFSLEHKPSKPPEALKMSDCVSDEKSSAASLAQSDRSKEHPIRFCLEHKPSKPPEALKMSDCDSDEESSAASLAQSDRSKEHPIRFSLEHKPSKPPEALKMSDCVSDEESSAASLAQSDRSKEHPIRFCLEHKPSKPPEALKMSDCDSDEESSAASLAQSDRSKEHPIRFSLEHKTSKPPEALKMSDCVSDEESSAASLAQSDRSKEHPIRFSLEHKTSKPPEALKMSDCVSDEKSSAASLAQSDRSKEHPIRFSLEHKPSNGQTTSSQLQEDTWKVFKSKAVAFLKKALRAHKKVLSAKHKGLFEEDEQEDEADEKLLECDSETSEAALKVVLHILKTMNHDEHPRILKQSYHETVGKYQRKLKSSLKRKHDCLFEAINAEEQPVPLQKIYTKLYLIEGESGEVNNEHEVRQIEKAFNKQKSTETLIKCEDVLKPLPNQRQPIRTVLTKGIAGIGKTVLSQKFILDWSDEKSNQDIQFLFSLPFRELNLFRSGRLSLMDLLYEFCPGLKESGIKDLTTYRVVFILDGLDECRLGLDFEERCCDAAQSASVDVLLTSLISGYLLPNASVWITTRPAAAGLIPPQYVDRVTEIRGFNNLQKEQYFHKKITDEELAKRVIANIRSARSLYIMCHVPLFCWISSIVLEEMCAKAGAGKMPKTLTQMYIHFLAHQTTQMFVKYSQEQQLDSRGNNKMILALGKLAFQQLEKGNLIFYEDDLRECDIDVKEASVYSGFLTKVFRVESCMQHKVFCFVHLSIQEFLAALYVHVIYKVHGFNLMKQTEKMSKTKRVSKLHKAAVDRALQSDSGHFDLFLRFLLGLSLESNQGLLRHLRIQVEPCEAQSHEETIKYIKGKIEDDSLHPVKYINLFHCLNELNDVSLVDHIQNYVDSDRDSLMDKCSSSASWAALVFVLLTSPERSEEIQLKKYTRTEEGLVRLLPAIKASTSAKLNDCNLSANSCQMLSSALSSASSQLCELDLTDNNVQDSGVEFLCSGLQNQHCRLKTLRLIRCGLTGKCCQSLASVLGCNSSRLRKLNLSHNDIEDSGVQLLCGGLGNVSCKLETLRLSFCSITQEGCAFLASAVKSNPSHLSELDLSYNHLGKCGEEMLSQALQEARCDFTKLKVNQNAEHWFKPGLRQYSRDLTLDLNTAHKLLIVEDNQTVRWSSKEQSYDNHPDRFDYWTQVLFQQGLTSRCYWEVEWTGNWAGIGVTYRGIGRKGPDNDCVMGYNKLSWSLHCSLHGYRAYHDYESVVLQVPLVGSRRVAVYLDWEGGILSFYRVSSGGSLTHLHTFSTKFTEPLFPVFRAWGKGSSLRLCQEGKKQQIIND